MKNILCVVPTYNNCLCRLDSYVTDTCIYLRVLTGELIGGLINVSLSDFIQIPDSEKLTIIN